MKAERTDGRIVTLPRDCECINHKVPHWIYMWKSSRDWKVAEAKKYAAEMDAIEAAASNTVPFSVFIRYEQVKLALGAVSGEIARIYADAEREMRQRGIARLIPEPEDELTELEQAAVQAHFDAAIDQARGKGGGEVKGG